MDQSDIEVQYGSTIVAQEGKGTIATTSERDGLAAFCPGVIVSTCWEGSRNEEE